MNSTWSAIAVGIAVAAAASYVIHEDERVRRAIEKARLAGVPLRLPQPGFDVQLPELAADFAMLDALVCGCAGSYAPPDDGTPTTGGATPLQPTLDDLIDHMQICAATQLFPDFPWPPISGDHPSVEELWDDLRLLSRRALANDICSAPTTPAT